MSELAPIYIATMRTRGAMERLGAGTAAVLKRAVCREVDEPLLPTLNDLPVTQGKLVVRQRYEQALNDYLEILQAEHTLSVEMLDQYISDMLIVRAGLQMIAEVEEAGHDHRISG